MLYKDDGCAVSKYADVSEARAASLIRAMKSHIRARHGRRYCEILMRTFTCGQRQTQS
jgi:hypothetical protein